MILSPLPCETDTSAPDISPELELDSPQMFSSAASNSLEEDWRTWTSPPEYDGIPDNTEGIAAFADLPLPTSTRLLIDIGGGEFDSTRRWVENRHSQLEMVVVDPFKRSREHNSRALALVQRRGGADVATSMSVLNVIDSRAARLAHCSALHANLRSGGVAFFKVWSGSGPVRGSCVATVDKQRGVYQANAPARVFEEDVRSVFGEAVEVIDEMNLLIAYKV